MSKATTDSRRGDLILVIAAAAVVLVDQLTKTWALRSFTYEPTHVFWTLQFVVAHNTGTAFSLFSGSGAGPVIALAAVVVVVVIVRMLRFVTGWPAAVGSALIIGGAIGNLADRLFRSHGAGLFGGAVVDWIDFGWWPVFNVADMAITTGAVLLGIAAVFAPETDQPDPDQPETDQPSSEGREGAPDALDDS